MGALKAITRITGAGTNAQPVEVAGDPAVFTLHLDPASFTVEKDTSVIPPRIKVSFTLAISDLLASVSEDPEPSTIARRTSAGELRAGIFIGDTAQAASTTMAVAGPSGLKGVEVGENGGFPQVGFLGATPVFVQSVDVLAADTDKLNDVVAALINLGLVVPA